MTTTANRTAGAVGPSTYGPVAGDIARVDALLTEIQHVEYPWLREMLQAVLAGSGKRMRPAITLLAGRLGNYDLDRLVPMAASVELLHTATLVHDDVIDAAPERRGKPTAAALFNNASSVMLGDYMFAHAAEFVARTGNLRVIHNFALTLRTMANGELTQDMSAYNYSPDVQRYLDRIWGKTASLFATAAEGGAIVGGLPEAQIDALRDYGKQLGMAFQIVDDILDFTSTADEMGKPVGSDLLAGTLTLPTLLYMERSPKENPVKRAFEGVRRRSNLQRAVDEIRADEALLTTAMDTARRFAESARSTLDAVPPGEVRETLDGIADYVIERRF